MGKRLVPQHLAMFWVASCLLIGTAQAWASKQNEHSWNSPTILFAIVLVAASGCVVTSALVLRLARRSGHGELGFAASYFYAISVLPLVHGITTPGVLYQANTATMAAVYWSLPIAVLCASPLLAPHSTLARALFSRWKDVVTVQFALVTGLALVMLLRPNLVPIPSAEPFGQLLPIVGFAASVALSLRHVGLAMVARRGAPIGVAFGYVWAGSSALAFPNARPYTAGFWLAHALDICGVLAGTVIAVRAYRSPESISSITRSIVVHDPISALELGLDPVIRDFVADLDRKDEITREHVVRTAELAMRVGENIGLNAPQLWRLGVGALLHDVGKLTIPIEILAKPGRLTDDETAVMRTHATAGAAMVGSSPGLVSTASIVRHHHERVDGAGYPAGLRATHIPIEARIVSACDAFDAMANSRQYRVGMGVEKALSILHEGAGTQWDTDVVNALRTLIDVTHEAPIATVFARVGREGTEAGLRDLVGPCGCVPLDDRELVLV